LLPLGFIAVVFGVIAGGVLALSLGFCVDARKNFQKQSESKAQMVRINHLMRFAQFHFATSADPMQIIFKVCDEYQPLVILGDFSKSARQQLKLLHRFIRRLDVQCYLGVYIDYFFKNWRQMTRSEISMCHTVCEVCVEAWRIMNWKSLDVVDRMERILNDRFVVRLFESAEDIRNIRKAIAVQNMDCLLYADAESDDVKPERKFAREIVAVTNVVPQLQPCHDSDSSSGAVLLTNSVAIGPPTETVVTVGPPVCEDVVYEDLASHKQADVEQQRRKEEFTLSVLSGILGDTDNARQSSHTHVVEENSSLPIPLVADAQVEKQIVPVLPTTETTSPILSPVLSGITPVVPMETKKSVPFEKPPVPTTPVSLEHGPPSNSESVGKMEIIADVRPRRPSLSVCDAPQDLTQARKHAPFAGPMKRVSPHHVVLEPQESGRRTESSSKPRRKWSTGRKMKSSFEKVNEAPLSTGESGEMPRPRLKQKQSSLAKIWSSSSLQKPKEDENPTPEVEEVLDEAQQLFRSFNDMVHFDKHLKFQSPIMPYEFAFLSEKESFDPADPDWDTICNRPEIDLYKYNKGADGVVMLKSYCVLKDIPVGIVAHCIRHIPTRLSWDTVFADFRILEKDVNGCEMIYCTIKAPWPVADRDFLQWRRTQYHEQQNVYTIMMRSASHPNHPEHPNYVRADTIISGYVVRPAPEDPANSAKLFALAQTDIMGLIPKWMVNATAQRAPVLWGDGLRKACNNYVKKHGRGIPTYVAEDRHTK